MIRTGAQVFAPAEPVAAVRRASIAYLAALVGAELITTYIDPRWGVACHAAIFLALVVQSASAVAGWGTNGPRSLAYRTWATDFYAAMALCPLIRIVSLAMPLDEVRQLDWYAMTAVPMLAAAWMVIRSAGYTRRQIGLCLDATWRSMPITLLVAISGVGLGYLEFRILRPAPLVDSFSLVPIVIAFVILLIGTGLMEELIFRGILQRATSAVWGSGRAIIYVSAVFAALHIGHRSALDVGFVFVVALYFGCVVRATQSLVGVIVAHGVTNFCLFVLFPLWLHPARPVSAELWALLSSLLRTVFKVR